MPGERPEGMPRGASDVHFHVFESAEKYPAAGDARYTPPSAPLDAFREECRALGIERMVFVQPSAYGYDNRCNLDAADRVGAQARVVVGLDPATSDAEIRTMHARGARAARINYGIGRPVDPALAGQVMAEAQSVARRVADLGWSLDFLAPEWLVGELLPRLHELPVPASIAHIGMCHGRNGTANERFVALRRALAEGRCYVKLTGIGRLSDHPDFEDLDPMVRALVAENPDRLLWGSDWPHLATPRHAGNAKLLLLLRRWTAGSADAFRKVLVDNPARLYGFRA